MGRGELQIPRTLKNWLIKSNVEFPGGLRKDHVEFPRVFVLGLKIYEGLHNFVKFLCVEVQKALLCLELQKVK